MTWILIAGGVMGAFTMLSILGSERQRRVDQMKQQADMEAECRRVEQESIPLVAAARSQ
jgi:hypothetical protein